MTKNDIKLILKEFRKKNKFSFSLGFSHLLTTASYFLNSENLRIKSYDMRDKAIEKYLHKYMKSPLDNNKTNIYNTAVDFSKEPIFVCWFQGEEQAPVMIKKCIDSMRKHAKNHEVILVTNENLSKYLDIPDYLTEKFNSGIICPANFSDYIRNSLLFKFGGLWLDSTVFCCDIPEWIFEKDFFTVNFGYDPNSSNIAKGRWTGFIIGGRKNYPLFGFFKESFEAYWKEEQYAIDYFLFDYCIRFAYDNIPVFKRDIDNLPVNNPRIFEMALALKNNATPSEWTFTEDTFFYKLSRHFNYNELTLNGDKTIYGLLLEETL